MQRVKPSKIVLRLIKNNDPEYHSLRKVIVCPLCDEPTATSIVSHYVNAHPDQEVLTSRISPEAAERSRTVQHSVELYRAAQNQLTYKQFCYFCNTICTYSKSLWIKHMITHCGYFNYKCQTCERKFSTPARYHTCERPSIVLTKMAIFKTTCLKGYVCELCNFVRFYESEMAAHLSNEHGNGHSMEYREIVFLELPKSKIGRPRRGAEVDYENVNEENYELDEVDEDEA